MSRMNYNRPIFAIIDGKVKSKSKKLKKFVKKKQKRKKERIKTCPKCNSYLIKKLNKKEQIWFLGCSTYPKCKHTENLKSELMHQEILQVDNINY